MYDKAKGILPPGQYLVGRDIPVGGYIYQRLMIVKTPPMYFTKVTKTL